MATTKHTGGGIAQVQQPIDPDETRWVWFCWPGAPVSSAWEITGADNLGTQDDQEVLGDDGLRYEHCNGVLIKPTTGAGSILVTNRCELSSGDVLDRTVQIKVRML